MSTARPRRSSSHANRGAALEGVLDELHRIYRLRGGAVVFRTPAPMRVVRRLRGSEFVCFHERKGPPDYTGAVQGQAICFDAKDCRGTRFAFDHLPEHQAQALDDWQAQDGFAFVLLRHQGQLHVLPWTALGPRWWAWRRQTGRAAPGTASLSAEDIASLGHPCGSGGWLPVVRSLLLHKESPHG